MIIKIFKLSGLALCSSFLLNLTLSSSAMAAKIKDTARYLPGHGGFLDRIDGILLGVPVGIFTIVNF